MQSSNVNPWFRANPHHRLGKGTAQCYNTVLGVMTMLELLLMQYREIFGEDFPLLQFDGEQETEVINILYDCVSKSLPYFRWSNNWWQASRCHY